MGTELATTQPGGSVKGQIARHWVQCLAWALIIIGPLIFVLGGLGSRFGFWDWRFGLGTLARNVGPKLLMSSFLVGVVCLGLTFMVRPRRGLIVSVLAILIPVIGLTYANSIRTKAQKLPPIHDITTDTQDPPAFTDAILSERAKVKDVNPVDYAGKRDRPDGELVSVLQTKAYPDIRPIVLPDEPGIVFNQAKSVARSMDWTIKSENMTAGRIEATDTTFWYGFKDDIVIRIRPSKGGGSIVDVRSVSRVGVSDIGTNAARIRKFLDAMQGT